MMPLRFLRWIGLPSCAALLLIALAGAPTEAARPGSAPSESDRLPAGTVFRDCAGCPEMVVVPSGGFEMGSTSAEQQSNGVPEIFADQESPRHRVTIGRAFAIGRTELTRDLYARFVAATNHRPVDDRGCGTYHPQSDAWTDDKSVSWRNPPFKQTDADPVVCVSWFDGQAYATWLSKRTGHRYRLPSEAEWEYAARGGTTTSRYWGESPEAACSHAQIMTVGTYELLGRPASWKNRLLCSGEQAYTRPVASYDPNPFGLYDMIGNVWEWVEDCAHNSFVGAPTDGSAWNEPDCKGRLLKGGAFHSAPFFSRAAARETGLEPAHAGVGTGFRLVRELDGSIPPGSIVPVSRKPIVADAVLGQRQFGPCTKCHTIEAGGADGIGPNLHGIVGRRAGTNRPGFAYSRVLRESRLTWDTARLDAFLSNPALLVPHTAMSFAGIADPQERANVVAYLALAGGDAGSTP